MKISLTSLDSARVVPKIDGNCESGIALDEGRTLAVFSTNMFATYVVI